MKHFKSLIIAASLGFVAHASAQTYTPWVLGGNSLSSTTPPTTAVFGTASDNPIEIRTYNLMRMYIDGGNGKTSGFIGVNTNTPRQMLHVKGGNFLISRTADITNKALGSTNGSILFGDETSQTYPYGSWGIEYVNDSSQGHGLNFWKTWDQNGGGLNNVVFLCEEKDYKGYVGINTKCPSSRLSVDGTIRAKEVVVSLDGWCDYVFLPNYKLTGLYELEAYIKEYSHLPNVPSECEVLENGVQLGEMNAVLLEKVEELTLYVIELQKQIDELKRQNEERV
ncbi:MAG: hypothetical protein IJ057_02535 [Bacteroidales bacterium]|nr:hypothetical protein [Bacteroidales bacterium]